MTMYESGIMCNILSADEGKEQWLVKKDDAWEMSDS